MMIRRIFAGSLVALLLSFPPFAAACDVSCSFMQIGTDCHFGQMGTRDSMPSVSKMDGMAMHEMPGAGHAVQQATSKTERAESRHMRIGEMGPCERQSCDGGSAILARASRPVDPQFQAVLAPGESSRADFSRLCLHDARDDIAHHRPADTSSLRLILRV